MSFNNATNYRLSSAPLTRRSRQANSASWATYNRSTHSASCDYETTSPENQQKSDDARSHFHNDSLGQDLVNAASKRDRRKGGKRSAVEQDKSQTGESLSSQQREASCEQSWDCAAPTPFPALSAEGHDTQPSSRGTTIHVGQSPRLRESTSTNGVKPKPTADDHRRRAETEYYEQTDQSGTVRRRSMIRNVSREDFLLGRGANPRTGVVTPGAHSANSSLEEAEILRARGIAAPAKWRQRGDAWIALQPGQPTPLPTPPKTSAAVASRGLRTPERLNAGRFNHNGSVPRPSNLGTYQELATSNLLSDTSTPMGCPGAYPQTPQDIGTTRGGTPSTKSQSIPRKPVGSSCSKPDGHTNSASHMRLASGETVIQRPHLREDTRSSSAPIRRIEPFGPGDVGKGLPAIPPTMPADKVSSLKQVSGQTFLDQGPKRQLGPDLISTTSGGCGKARIEKALPSLPMTSGPFLPSPAQEPEDDKPLQSGSKTVSSGERQELVVIHGPRELRQSRPYTRNTRGTPSIDLERLKEQPRGSRPMPIPMYDNPPHVPLETWDRRQQDARHRWEDPRRREQRARHRPVESMYNQSRTTTSTNTLMSTDTFPPRRVRSPKPRGQTFQPYMEDPFITTDHRTSTLPTMGMSMNMSTGTELDGLVTVPHIRQGPRSMSRPMMPGRALGMRNIPQMEPVLQPYIEPMVAENQSNPIGMQPRSHQLDTADVERLPPASMMVNREHAARSIDAVKPDLKITTQIEHGLQRKCSRCVNGFVTGQQHNTGGVSPTLRAEPHANNLGNLDEHPTDAPHDTSTVPWPPSQIRPNLAPDVPLGPQPSPIGDSEPDQRDHNACCATCCKEYDCHEGCLSHPSPSASPSRPSRSGSGPLSSRTNSSASSSDAQPPTPKARGTKLDFVRSAFKRSVDRSPSPEKQPDRGPTTFTDHGAPPSTGSKTTLVELATPISPATFWGGEGAGVTAGALEAAKAAIEKQNEQSHLSSARPRRSKRADSDTSLRSAFPALTPSALRPRSKKTAHLNGKPTVHVTTPTGTRLVPSARPKSRNASGASVATIDIPMPGLGSISLGAIWEMALVPYDASKMWLRNHPSVMTIGWTLLERVWEMGQIMTGTGFKLWSVVFIYSKTGRLKLKRGDTAGGFVADCARSALYLLMCVAIGVVVARVLRWMLQAMAILGMVVRLFGWVLVKLLGHGLLW